MALGTYEQLRGLSLPELGGAQCAEAEVSVDEAAEVVVRRAAALEALGPHAVAESAPAEEEALEESRGIDVGPDGNTVRGHVAAAALPKSISPANLGPKLTIIEEAAPSPNEKSTGSPVPSSASRRWLASGLTRERTFRFLSAGRRAAPKLCAGAGAGGEGPAVFEEVEEGALERDDEPIGGRIGRIWSRVTRSLSSAFQRIASSGAQMSVLGKGDEGDDDRPSPVGKVIVEVDGQRGKKDVEAGGESILLYRLGSFSALTVFAADDAKQQARDGRLVRAEHRQDGDVAWSVYFEYVKKLGLPTSAVVLALLFGGQALSLASDWWLAKWSRSGDQADLR